MNRLLFGLSGVLIIGTIIVLLYTPQTAGNLTIAVLLLSAAIATFILYRRDRDDEEAVDEVEGEDDEDD